MGRGSNRSSGFPNNNALSANFRVRGVNNVASDSATP